MHIDFDPLHADVEPPSRATELSAGYDARAYLTGRSVRIRDSSGTVVERAASANGELRLEAGEIALIPLGFRARLPAGYEAQVRIRSSAALKKGLVLPNAPGTIDADYPDEWLVMVRNDAGRAVTIEHRERIAQIVLARYEVATWEPGRVGRSTDRAGGFGSTG